jgi:hypothetical protein
MKMIIVMETWSLRPEFADQALELMQKMDDLVGPNAHADAGWSGHARFYRDHDDPARVLMSDPWRSVDEHRALSDSEETLLADFQDAYCASPRKVKYFDELPVDVDHESIDHE